MLRYKLIHPEILAALGSAGHGSRVLIADGHYPFTTAAGPEAVHVFLNLTPGRLTVTEVLEAVADAIPVEAAAVMQPPPQLPTPEVFADFERMLPAVQLEGLERFEFYAAAKSEDTALVIATGDTRTYANLLLTIGVASS
jgi:L-fucose mutarotase